MTSRHNAGASVLGENVYHGRRSLIGITQADRLGHMWLLGKTGAGKSASITASATFGPSAYPDNVTCWHIISLQ